MWEIFLNPISFKVFVAKADLKPPAQNKTISLLLSILPSLKYALSGSSQNSNMPLGICAESSIRPSFCNSLMSLMSIKLHFFYDVGRVPPLVK